MRNKKSVSIGKEQTVFRGSLYEVRQAPVVLPSGRKVKFERVQRKPSVVVLAFDRKGLLLLNREYRPKYKKWVWRFPGGTVEEGETSRAAANRELREETGFRARNLKLFHRVATGQSIEWQRSVFIARDLVPSKLLEDEDEEIKTVFLSLAEAVRLVKKGKVEHDLTEYLIYKLFWERGR